MITKTPHPIVGSRFGLWRVYCAECGEPGRVIAAECAQEWYCERCSPRELPLLGISATKDDMSPWQENAIRCLEEVS